ncbi:DsbA family protein [Candidatus Frankia alpina]|uniref:DsbA family protein n=1 Tax=Candidatus Frankia alpina TaxID=2699483 RepID=UPI003AF883D1
MPGMRVEIWADVVCAWAYIGKRRLERTLADWSGEDVDVVWRPFRIDPTAPAAAVPLAQALRDPVVAGALSRCGPRRVARGGPGAGGTGRRRGRTGVAVGRCLAGRSDRRPSPHRTRL